MEFKTEKNLGDTIAFTPKGMKTQTTGTVEGIRISMNEIHFEIAYNLSYKNRNGRTLYETYYEKYENG